MLPESNRLCARGEHFKKGNACRSEHFVFRNYHSHFFHFFSWDPSFFTTLMPFGWSSSKSKHPLGPPWVVAEPAYFWNSPLVGSYPKSTNNGMYMYKLNPLRTLKLKRLGKVLGSMTTWKLNVRDLYNPPSQGGNFLRVKNMK
jgi:hypothetical protein